MKIRKIIDRYKFGRRHGLGFFPSSQKMWTYVREHGTLVGRHESTHASYIGPDGLERNAYQRNEKVIRYTYLLAGKEYAILEVIENENARDED